jgi:tRNA(Ile)-lysidine synthase
MAVNELIDDWHGQKELTLPGVRVVRKSEQLEMKTTKTLKPGAC